ncbi:MAG: hypothetical protein A2Y21_01385 [Clostridiales bacterium GWC2_40_7]|nr:MAG: hypothetical protein A2Y21_01385 [Clostridiales bacterium GWC2_40_7]
MPHRFTAGDIKKIALRLGLHQINNKKWSGTDIKGNFLQTYIHDHNDGVQILVGTARQHAAQMGFKDTDDMHDFMNNKKRRR